MAASILLTQLEKSELATTEFLEFLYDAQDSCLILVSTSQLAALSSNDFNPADWARFRALITRLSRNNRVLLCADIDASCVRADCDRPCDIEYQRSTHSLLGAKASAPGTALVGYIGSDLRDLVRRYDLSLRGRPRKSEFEDGVLSLVAFAVNEIIFLDRQLGQHWDNRGYANTLDWIIGFARKRGVSQFTIVTTATTFEPEIHAWCVTNNVKLDNRSARQLPHERAIITKRFSISIDRGFDLLTVAGKLKSCGVYIQQAGADFSAEFAAAAKLPPRYECVHCHK